MFFDARDIIIRGMGKLPIYEMPHTFDSTLVEGKSWKVGTFQSFLESCLSLEKVSRCTSQNRKYVTMTREMVP